MYIEAMLESVLEQTSKPFQHIFVDGGSTDETLDLVARYSIGVGYEVILIESQQLGISHAMNEGASMATGEFIMFLHSDDLFFDKNSLGALERSASSGNVSWVSGACEYIDALGNNCGKGADVSYTRSKLLRSNIVSHPSTILRTRILTELGGFDDSLKYAMDYDLWLRVSQVENLVRLPDYVAKFRIHDQSLSSANAKQMREEDLCVRLKYTEGRFNLLRARGVFALVEFMSKHSVIRNTYIWLKEHLILQ